MFLNSHGRQEATRQTTTFPSVEGSTLGRARVAVARTTKSLTEQKFTAGSEPVGFLLLAPRGTKTGLSPSRTDGSCEAAVESNAPPGEANS